MINLQENIILISNHYSQICNLYICHKSLNKEEILSYELGEKIIDKIFENSLKYNFIPKFYLLGGDVIYYWEIISKPLIDYIKSKKIYCEIYLQFENKNDKYEDIFLYLQEQNIFLNFIYNEDTKEYLEKAITYRPFLKLYYIVNNNTTNNLFINYEYFNKINIRKLKLIFINNINLDLTFKELEKIKNYIINKFLENFIPLIPENINNNFIKNLMIDKENEIDLQLLHHSELVSYHCPMSIGQRIIINQFGNLFICNDKEFNTENEMYLGNINDCDLNLIDPFKKIYNFLDSDEKPYILNPQNDKKECKTCNIYTVCHLNCFANNLIVTNDVKLCSSNYCKLEQNLYNISIEIINILDKNKNELFKDYFYTQCIKGLEESI